MKNSQNTHPTPIYISIVKWVLNIALILLSLAFIALLITGGFQLDLGFARISITTLRRVSLYLSLAFTLRFVLSDWLYQDGFSVHIRKITSRRYFPLYLFIGVAILFITAKFRYHLAFKNSALDFSFYEYAFYHTLNSEFMFTPFIKQSYFAMHFSPITLLYIPIYGLTGSVYPTMALQAAMLALTVVPAYYLAKTVWKDALSASALALGLTTMLSFGYMLECDFHQEAIYPALLLFSVLAIERKRPLAFLLTLLALWTVKEDAFIYTAVLSISAIIYRRWWKIGLAGLLSSVVVWFAVIYLVIPAFGTDAYGPAEIVANRWGQYGDNYFEVLWWFITHPLVVWKALMCGEVNYFARSFLYIPLLSPWVLTVIPQVVINRTSSMLIQQDLVSYFGAPIATLFAVSAIYGIKRLSEWSKHLGLERGKVITTFALLVMILNFGHIRIFKTDPQLTVARSILESVPDDAPIATQDHIYPYIPPRDEIYPLTEREPDLTGAEYIFLDTGHTGFRFTGLNAVFLVRDLLDDDDYELVESSCDGSSTVYDGGEKSYDRFYLFVRVEDLDKNS